MQSFILLFLYGAIGFGLKHLPLLPKNTSMFLNKFIIYVPLPAMILLQVQKLNFTAEAMMPVVIAWVVMALSALCVLLASKFFHFSKQETGALMLVSVLGNTAFVGIPIISTYYSTQAIAYALMYDQLGTCIGFATYGSFIGVYYANTGEFSLKKVLLKMLTFPPLVAMVLALSLNNASFNPYVYDILTLLAALTVPVALIAVGMQLQLKLPRSELTAFTVSLSVKLVLSPIFAFLVCFFMGWEGVIADVSIIQAGMASMVTAGAIASALGFAPRLSSAIVGYGVIFSFFTSFVVYQLLSL